MLSPQCTDERVNRVNPGPVSSARRWRRRARPLATAAEVEPYVHSQAFFSQQGQKTIVARLAAAESSHHGGAVPARGKWTPLLEPRLVWPGKPRMWCWPMPSGSNAGVTVEHPMCGGLSNRLRPEQAERPRRIEPELMKLLPSRSGRTSAIRMIFHGRDRLHAPQTRLRRLPLADAPAPAIPSTAARVDLNTS